MMAFQLKAQIGAAAQRWILQRMHHKTMFANLNKGVIHIMILFSRLLLKMKVMFSGIFCGFFHGDMIAYKYKCDSIL
jgi:hypothetical protein